MRDRPDAIMLFAAGFGTRMRPLTDHRPKPLVTVAGKPLLDHALALAHSAEVPRAVVNAHYLADQIQAHLEGSGIPVSLEEPDLLDTGGGLRAALPLLGWPTSVYTLNTDAIWTGANPICALRQHWDDKSMDALMVLIPADRAREHAGAGDFAMDPTGRLRRGPGFVYSGAQIMKTGLLAGMPEGAFSLTHCWADAAKAGRLFGLVHRGEWCDVGHPGGIATAEALLTGAADG